MGKGSITKDIFLSFLRCNKLALYKSLDLEEKNFRHISLEENEALFKELAYKLACKSENGVSKKIIRNKQFLINEDEHISADVILKHPKENILLEIVCSPNLIDGAELNWLAYKLYLIRKTNYKIHKIWIVKVDKKYEKKGELSDDILFIKDVTTKINRYLHTIPSLIEKINLYLRQRELPEKQKGPFCLEPNPCPFKKLCWEDMPGKNSVFEIDGLLARKKFNLFWKEISSFEEIPKNALNKRQKIQVKYGIRNVPYQKTDELNSWLNNINKQGRVWFLSIELAYPVLPMHENAKPFTSVPFQFSLKYQKSGSVNYTPYDFLNIVPSEPDSTLVFLLNLIEKLSLDVEAPIIIYGSKRIKKCLTNLATWYPGYSRVINNILSRLIDLQEVFEECWYYHPKFKGSTELSRIAPIMIPEIPYGHQFIKSRTHAGNEFIRYLNKPSGISKETQRHLSEYSNLNSHSLMEIVKFIRQIKQ
jgi:hypothetical protein